MTAGGPRLAFALLAVAGLAFLAGRATAPVATPGPATPQDRETGAAPAPALPPAAAAAPGSAPVDPTADPTADATPAPDITGRVLDGGGVPVVGATIEAAPESFWAEDPKLAIFGIEPFRWDPMEEALAAAARLEARLRAGVRTGKTDSFGEFRLTGLESDFLYQVYANADGYDGTAEFDVAPGDRVELVLERGGRVRVTVVRADGKPVGRAEVNAKPWTPEAPVLSFAPGEVDLVAEADGMESDPVAVTVRLDETCEAVCRLVPRWSIDLLVRWPEGVNADDVDISAVAAEGDIPPAYGASAWRVGPDRVRIGDLPAGRWRVGAVYPGGRTAATIDVDLVDRDVRAKLDLPPLDERDFVTVVVLDPAGHSVTDAEVVPWGSQRDYGGSGTRGRPFGPGRFRVFHAVPFDAEVARWSVDVSSREYGRRSVDYRAGVDREVVVRFDPVATVVVRVPGAGEVSLTLRPAEPCSGPEALYSWTKDEGRARFELVPHGEWVLTVPNRPGVAMRVHVPAAGEIVWSPEPLRALLVEHVRPDGCAERLGLRQGDLVVGIGGVAFPDALHREAAWAAAKLETAVTLDVRRGGRTIRIPADVRRLDEEGGTRLTPALGPGD